MTDKAVAALSQFKCHKIVSAAKILVVDPATITLEVSPNTDFPLGQVVVRVEPNLFARYMPKPGDYYVVYNAGKPNEYRSISPALEFEEGYDPK